jgi:diacylglycerol kinase family enzyme
VTKHAENDDGLLSLYTLQDTDRRGLLRFGWALLRGQHTTLDEVWCCETARATIETKPRRRIVIDGEVIGRTPLHLSIRPGALKVMVPSPETPV